MIIPKILIVDDDINLLELLRMRLESANYEVVSSPKEEDALEAVKHHIFDLSIIDLQLAHRNGISLMEEFHLINPALPIIILTAYGSIESAVEAMKRGAYDYLTKPFDARELLLKIENALENQRLKYEVKRLKELLDDRYNFKNIVVKSEKMQRVLQQVFLVSKKDSTIIIYGESGTGKELISKSIHFSSDRKDKPFVAINCAAVPESLLESELFGYEKGSFTGAQSSSKGLLSHANEGTIFLDEIGDMPLSIQAKLLRFLEERQFYPIGSQKPVRVNLRVIVATNKNLEDMVKKGQFRKDLFYRIHVIPIHIPPLRERKEDIPLLVEHFLKEFTQQMKKEVKGLVPLAMQRLMFYDWPGNVRELKNTIEYAVAMNQQDVITEELIFPTRSPEPLKPLKESRANFEKGYLTNLLELTKGNVSKAAKLAKKYRTDFYNLLKKHNIKPEDFK
jgi:two-component system response regulator GlrR